MEQTHCPTSENLQLERLVAGARGEIERLGYSRRSRNRYRAIWEHLIEFSRQKELGDEFSADLAARFLEEYQVRDVQGDGPGEGWRRHMEFGVKVLADFAKNRRIERAFMEVQAIHLLPTMHNTLRDYEQYCKDRLHLRPWTLHRRTTELTIFLDFLHTRKARTLDQIQALDLTEFVSCRDHLKSKTVARIVSDVRSFLRFLTMRGTLQKDLSAELPKIHVPRDATIPSVWDSRTHRQTSRCGRSQFGEGETRLRHSLAGMPLGVACRGYSHAETGPPPLGGIDNRNHPSEDGRAVKAASNQRGR